MAAQHVARIVQMLQNVGEHDQVELLAAVERVLFRSRHIADVGLGDPRFGFFNRSREEIDAHYAVAISFGQLRPVNTGSATDIQDPQTPRKAANDVRNFGIRNLEIRPVGRHTATSCSRDGTTASSVSRAASFRARSMQTSILMYSNSATRPHRGSPTPSKYSLARLRCLR